jgi:hypothetical protein
MNNNLEVKTAPRISLAVEPDGAAAPTPGGANEPSAPNSFPVSARSRRALRIAPPIDDGFRPFRVY